MGSEFSCMIKEAKLLGMALGVPCLDGVEEAEAQCALLNSESLCDGCFTSDSDVFLFGARTVYRDICLGEGGFVVCYEMADIERELGFGRNSLITLAVLLGSDYSPGVRGLGPESACRIVKSIGDKGVLQRIALEGLSFARKGSRKQGCSRRCNYKENESDRQLNINGSERDLQGEEHFQQVVDAYLKPKCHSADSEAVHRVLALHPFQHPKLQQLCAQFFGWPHEKTDEYILPKIAERDLRRFANLRSITSELGVQPPLDKMPVKCPVSGIIKQRKVHGQACFEVSWEKMHRLETSIVPGDLVESACPEKILEFEQRRAQRGKKQNRSKARQKKSENRVAMKEIDLRLQDLLLDVEQGNSPRHTVSLSMEAILRNKDVTKVGLLNQSLLCTADSRRQIELNIASGSCSTVSSAPATEVIDLLSPSPPQHRCLVSKCQQSGLECIDVIDSSESESEGSADHAKKSRELRLFLASIREDLK